MRSASAAVLPVLLVLASCAPRDDIADGVVALPRVFASTPTTTGCWCCQKRVAGGGKQERDLRRVFAFDLATERVIEEPVVTLHLDELIAEARAAGFDLPVKTTKKGRQRVDLKLRGSELVMVPGSDELLLSAVDHLLLRVAFDGKLRGTRVLDARELPQPEAMTFLPDGRLLVASEGVDGPAVIRVVAFR